MSILRVTRARAIWLKPGLFCASAAILMAGSAYLGESDAPPAKRNSRPVPRVAPAPLTPEPVESAAPVAPLAIPAQALQPAAAAPVSLARQVDGLLASGTPQDAHKAWRIASECNRTRATEAYRVQQSMPSDVAKACGDLTPGQISSRAAWLEKAAAAGVRGAALDYFSEASQLQVTPGPTPDAPIITATDDPAALARAEQYAAIAEARGDPALLQSRGMGAENRGDWAGAITYEVAFVAAYRIDYAGNPAKVVRMERTSKDIVARYATHLTDAEAAAAVAAGMRMASNFKKE